MNLFFVSALPICGDSDGNLIINSIIRISTKRVLTVEEGLLSVVVGCNSDAQSVIMPRLLECAAVHKAKKSDVFRPVPPMSPFLIPRV